MLIYIDETELEVELEVGDEFKNLRDLSGRLGLTYKDSTNARKALLKTIEQYVSWEQTGRRYKLLEIREQKKERQDKRKEKESKYGEAVFSILQNRLNGEGYITLWEIAIQVLDKRAYNDILLMNTEKPRRPVELQMTEQEKEHILLLLRQSAYAVLRPALSSLSRLKKIKRQEVWIGTTEQGGKQKLTKKEERRYLDTRESLLKKQGIKPKRVELDRKFNARFSKQVLAEAADLQYESIHRALYIKILAPDSSARTTSQRGLRDTIVLKCLEAYDKEQAKLNKKLETHETFELPWWEQELLGIRRGDVEALLAML